MSFKLSFKRLSVENISCCLGIYRYTSETKKVFSWLISLLVTLFKHRTSSSVMCLLCTQKEFIYTVSTSRREFKLRLRSLKYVGFFSLDLVLSWGIQPHCTKKPPCNWYLSSKTFELIATRLINYCDATYFHFN